ncbi:sensor histidine kinase [Paraconexibacter sp.]|uniref:sensor histidine kinase n=1 Tax=Paraconexibacter sp. TaxID=2949640 RepID=UPI0035649820
MSALVNPDGLGLLVIERPPFVGSFIKAFDRAPDVHIVAVAESLHDIAPGALDAADIIYVGDGVVPSDGDAETLWAEGRRVIVGQTRPADDGGDLWLERGAAAVVSRTARPQVLVNAVRRAAVRQAARPGAEPAKEREPPAADPAPSRPTEPSGSGGIEALRASEAMAIAQRIREELATTLHNGPLQLLLAARQEIEAAEDGDELGLGRARRFVYDATLQIRDELHELTLPDPEVLGFRNALTRLVERKAALTNAHAVVDVTDDLGSPRDGSAIIDMTRELLMNVVKHARASTLTVDARRDGDGIVLTISDDGVGFTPARAAQAQADGHFGLNLVRRRVDELGGTLALRSAPGSGTEVVIRLPRG